MHLFLIEQDAMGGYETYDSAVVCAATAQEARSYHPDGYTWHEEGQCYVDEANYPAPNHSWPNGPKFVTAKMIGSASPTIERGVVLASFNAG